jgi:hypothetical protein
MWLKKPNPGLTRYLLRLPRSKLVILMGLVTGQCPSKKHLHYMGLIDEAICIACGMEDESVFHLLCDCSSLISLRMRTGSGRWRIWRGRLHMHCCDSRWQVANSLWLLDLFILMNISSILYCVILFVCLFVSFWSFNFFLCGAHSPTFNPSIKKMGNLLFFSNNRRTNLLGFSADLRCRRF